MAAEGAIFARLRILRRVRLLRNRLRMRAALMMRTMVRRRTFLRVLVSNNSRAVLVRAAAARTFAVRVVRMPVGQLRNDHIRRQDGEAEESRCSKMPWLHRFGYRKTATGCQMPNDCNFRKMANRLRSIVKLTAASQLNQVGHFPAGHFSCGTQVLAAMKHPH
jgi:hypothetical protein